MRPSDTSSLIELHAALHPSAARKEGPTPSSPFLLGVDGGATKTIAAVFDVDGERVWTGEAGPSNPYTVGFERAIGAVGAAIDAALRNAAVPEERIVGAVIAGASIDGPEEIARFSSGLSAVGSMQRSVFVNDVVAAWAATTLGEAGVALISGTGSNCFGVDRTGATWRCGGWGHELDDAGSGFAIGRDGVLAALRERDGRGPVTTLTARALQHFRMIDVAALARDIGRDPSKDRVAAFAPEVVATANEGDAVAIAILNAAGAALGEHVLAVARHIDVGDDLDIGTVGGTFRAGHWLTGPLLRTVHGVLPGARLVPPRLPAVGGALWLAARLVGIESRLDADRLTTLFADR